MISLAGSLRDYLRVRRGLGFKLQYEGTALADFVKFLNRQGAAYITNDIALRWAVRPTHVDPSHWTRRLSMVRLFAQYRSASDPRTVIPPVGLLPNKYRRKPPYIYSNREIDDLIAGARRLPSKMGLRPHVYATLLGLLTVTGMRLGEALALDRDDVDLSDEVIKVRTAKYGKARLIPIHGTTQTALADYARRRDQLLGLAGAPAFFVSDAGTRITQWAARETFVRLSREIGLRGPGGRFGHGPRLHDIRHRFAAVTLLRWYRAAFDVERHMSRLSTYLGHTHVTDTYWYISAIPELLQLASQPLERPMEVEP
jgi:integrase/recombinase XerD